MNTHIPCQRRSDVSNHIYIVEYIYVCVCVCVAYAGIYLI